MSPLIALSPTMSALGVAIAGLAVGLLMILDGKAGRRHRRDLINAKTLDLDNRAPYSARRRLAG